MGFDLRYYLITGGAFHQAPVYADNGRYFRGTTIVGPGSWGWRVRYVQRLLRKLGYDLPVYGVDGNYGSETELAVRQFQQDDGLLSDGMVGPITLRRMKEAAEFKIVSAGVAGDDKG